jgi:hypothetical protein
MISIQNLAKQGDSPVIPVPFWNAMHIRNWLKSEGLEVLVPFILDSLDGMQMMFIMKEQCETLSTQFPIEVRQFLALTYQLKNHHTTTDLIKTNKQFLEQAKMYCGQQRALLTILGKYPKANIFPFVDFELSQESLLCAWHNSHAQMKGRLSMLEISKKDTTDNIKILYEVQKNLIVDIKLYERLLLEDPTPERLEHWRNVMKPRNRMRETKVGQDDLPPGFNTVINDTVESVLSLI